MTARPILLPPHPHPLPTRGRGAARLPALAHHAAGKARAVGLNTKGAASATTHRAGPPPAAAAPGASLLPCGGGSGWGRLAQALPQEGRP